MCGCLDCELLCAVVWCNVFVVRVCVRVLMCVVCVACKVLCDVVGRVLLLLLFVWVCC